MTAPNNNPRTTPAPKLVPQLLQRADAGAELLDAHRDLAVQPLLLLAPGGGEPVQALVHLVHAEGRRLLGADSGCEK